AYVTGRGKHMSVDLVKDGLSAPVRRGVNILIQVAFIAFAGAVLIAGGLRAVAIAWHQVSAVLQVPMGAVYAALPVSGVLIVLYSL
ncbi:TRAP transporter small permease subunit, partial [Mycobacterium tuberculosis]|nr:TRAP transporter small permease subunit [Mycobacterium tuberculosis]